MPLLKKLKSFTDKKMVTKTFKLKVNWDSNLLKGVKNFFKQMRKLIP